MSEKYPDSSERTEAEKFTAEDEIVRYADGSSALIFSSEGGVVAWGGHKWVDSPAMRSGNTLIIETASGNQYAIGQGVILNARTHEGLNVPVGAELPDITLGESWTIPGVMKTSKIVSVAAEYKIVPEGYGDRQVDFPSPFEGAKNDLAAKRTALSERGIR